MVRHRVSLGSSSVGIVYGVLGIVSCATLLTPVGPPCSLPASSSSVCRQWPKRVPKSGTPPNQHANQLIVLHGLCWNILRVVGLLRTTPSFWTLRRDTIAPSTSFPLMSLLEKFRSPLPHLPRRCHKQ
jgi:hypothetical protein